MQNHNLTHYSAIKPIVYIDSGLGGLPYLEWFAKRNPDLPLVYVADTKNFPYGSKSEAEVKSIVISLVAQIVECYSPRLIVIACNTASVVSLAELRAQFSIPFVGVVPAVKPAAEKSRKKKIGVLATERTVQDVYLANLITNFASDCKVHRYGASELVDFVENQWLTADDSENAAVLAKSLNFFKETDIDEIVLGCTHFLFLAESIKTHFSERLPGISVVDSREGVGKQTERLLARNRESKSSEKIMVLTSLENIDTEKYKAFAERFQIKFKGLICKDAYIME